MNSMLHRAEADPDVRLLRSRMTGEVSVPGDDDWETARLAWNLAVDQHPVAVAFPESAGDVVAAVDFARASGLRVAAQGTGHGAAALDLEETILVKTSRLRGVEIDPVARRARAEAGVLWLEVVTAAAEHGLVALHGSSPDVGVVGYTLGGGMGWLARSHGLAANSVLAVELVTADGRLVRADRDNEPDLFWAVRGGGSFGVVTAIEFALCPLREVYAGVLFFPIERAAEVLGAWRRWVDGVPETVTSVGRLLRLPPFPEIPEPIRGRDFVVVEAAMQDGEAAGRELLRPLRELGPELDSFATVPAAALGSLHMDPEQPVPGEGHGMLLDDVTGEAIERLVAAAGAESGSTLLSAELRHLGGALAEPSPEHGAVGAIDAGFAYFAVGIAPTPAAKVVTREQVQRTIDALAPWDAGRAYLNFSERPTAGGSLFSEQAHRRLQRIKTRVDPGDVIRANQRVRPA